MGGRDVYYKVSIRSALHVGGALRFLEIARGLANDIVGRLVSLFFFYSLLFHVLLFKWSQLVATDLYKFRVVYRDRLPLFYFKFLLQLAICHLAIFLLQLLTIFLGLQLFALYFFLLFYLYLMAIGFLFSQ